MKAFSYLKKENELAIGVDTGIDRLDLTMAFNIYQNAKRVPHPVTFSFIQVMVEMGYFSKDAIDSILSDPWVRSKVDRLRIQGDVTMDVPVARPSKIVCVGRNYAAHVKELNHEMPEGPVFFAKAPSTLCSPGDPIVIPAWFEGRVDHEAELGVVIGKLGKDIPESEAMEYIAGYTIINDVTARSMQKTDIEKGNPWFRSKSFDTFCPMGPYLVPRDAVDDPHNLDIRLTVNGETRQESNTSLMMFKLPTLIHLLSKYMTLQPGDVIATGTPEGVSEIKHGDVVEITVTGLGTLTNPVQKESLS